MRFTHTVTSRPPYTLEAFVRLRMCRGSPSAANVPSVPPVLSCVQYWPDGVARAAFTLACTPPIADALHAALPTYPDELAPHLTARESCVTSRVDSRLRVGHGLAQGSERLLDGLVSDGLDVARELCPVEAGRLRLGMLLLVLL